MTVMLGGSHELVTLRSYAYGGEAHLDLSSFLLFYIGSVAFILYSLNISPKKNFFKGNCSLLLPA